MTFIRKLTTKTGTYLVKVENVREGGKIRQKHLCMVGKMVDGKQAMYGQIRDSEITDVSVAGNVLVLREIMQQLGLQEILDMHTDNHGKWLAALVLAHCTNPGSLNRMKRWCRNYGASDLLGLQPEERRKDRFYRALDYLNPQTIARIEKELWESMQSFTKKADSLFYDVTKTYFYGTKCGIAKIGYNSQGIDLPQISIGLAVTNPYGFPLFHQVYDGNIQDIRSIDQAVKSLKDYGITKTTLVWDRGFTSESAIANAKGIDLDVIAGLPLKGGLKEKAIGMREGINTISNRVRLSTQILYAKGFPFAVYGHKGRLVICSNEKERALLKELRYDEIEDAIQRTAKGVQIKERLRKYVNNGRINKGEVAKAETTDGLYALFSTNSFLSTKEIVKTYFEKDRVEKAFKCLKGMIELRPIRHWLSGRVRAHVFICYLSYALLSMLDWRLKSAGIEISLEQALGLLENLHRVRIYDPATGNSFVKHTTMSKQQEALFKAVNKGLMGSVV